MKIIKKIITNPFYSLEKLYKRFYIALFAVIPALFYSILGYKTLFGFYGIGDICYELSYIDMYKKRIDKKLRVIAAKKRMNYFVFYPSIDTISRISEKLERLLLFDDIRFLKKYAFIKDVSHSRVKGNEPTLQKMSLFYDVPSNVITFPTIQSCDEIFPVYNSVLVNYRSNYYNSKKISVFIDKIVSCLLEKNITVYVNTNDISDVERFKGSVNQIFLPLSNMLYSAHLFLAIVSIRTGLLDFIVNSKSNIYSLYSNDSKGKLLLSKFSLLDWRGNSNITEVIVDNASPQLIVNEILS